MSTELEIFAPFAKKGKATNELGTNCIIYTRVSSKEQAEGYSLDTQRKEIEEFAKKRKLNILGYFGGIYESANKAERAEFNRMVAFARKSKEKVSYILIAYIDRFDRSAINGIYITNTLRRENIQLMAVSFPIDNRTPEGKLQQNMQFLIAEYDNDLRRVRCGKGMREMLEEGYWPALAPLGYDQAFDENEVQKITVNDQGRILRKAFLWKAEGKYTNLEIVAKLKALGLHTTRTRLTEIFRNTFYCGMLSHKMLNGRILPGKHEPLISKELFLKVNNIGTKNPKGKHADEFKDIPLKHFIKCNECGTPFTGYIVRAKNLWYYKCNRTGCKCNRRAENLNKKFIDRLKMFQINPNYMEPVKDEFMKMAYNQTEGNRQSEAILKANLKEAESKIEKLQEKFILEEIDRNTFDKFRVKYESEKAKILEELDTLTVNLSNLEKSITKYCNLLMKLPDLWASEDYQAKKELQNFLFPEGLIYFRQIDDYRTTKINLPALDLLRISTGLGENKNVLSDFYVEKNALVVSTGIEPVSKV